MAAVERDVGRFGVLFYYQDQADQVMRRDWFQANHSSDVNVESHRSGNVTKILKF